ncbi:hypothetical protein ABT352_33030 [Streptosporangium sp. NPDC000563]|uniref:hypothetical protein n=1 Tax=Streptosporangium sp. NPDC000563 TaxID=3154366 RepID=UPI0033264B3C
MSDKDPSFDRAARYLADALGIDPEAVLASSREHVDSLTQLDGPQGAPTYGESLLLALAKVARDHEVARSRGDLLVHGDADYPWIAEVRLGHSQLVARGTGLSWGAALGNALPGIYALRAGEWTLTLSGPDGDEASLKKRSLSATFRTRAGVEAAVRARTWHQVRDAMQQERDARLAAEVEPS